MIEPHSKSKASSITIVENPDKQKRAPYKVETKSTIHQRETETECRPYFVDLSALPPSQLDDLREAGYLKQSNSISDAADDDDSSGSFPFKISLLRSKHIDYVSSVWRTPAGVLSGGVSHQLKSSFVSLDASQPWMMYWCLQSCDLLSHNPSLTERRGIFSSLQKCWTWTCSYDCKEETGGGGGFGGGPGQLPHAATTYAAILVLCILMTTTTTSSTTTSSMEDDGEHADDDTDTKNIEDTENADLLFRRQVRDYLTSLRVPLAIWMASLQKKQQQQHHQIMQKKHDTNGCFRMHTDGEVDVRATYCVAVVASLLHLWDVATTGSKNEKDKGGGGGDDDDGTVLLKKRRMIDKVLAAQFVARCQTYEGGFGGEPFSEAHGGYTFCALVALVLLLQPEKEEENAEQSSSSSAAAAVLQSLIDLPALVGWLTRRQMGYEGGFQGRANKLVDGCYSFWQGSALAIASQLLHQLRGKQQEVSATSTNLLDAGAWTDSCSSSCDNDLVLFDTAMLERYILLCAQEPAGGLRDKPSKPRDFYHSCYNLSGLSVAQLSGIHFGHVEQSQVAKTHPIYNIRVDRVQQVNEYYCSFAKAQGSAQRRP